MHPRGEFQVGLKNTIWILVAIVQQVQRSGPILMVAVQSHYLPTLEKLLLPLDQEYLLFYELKDDPAEETVRYHLV